MYCHMRNFLSTILNFKFICLAFIWNILIVSGLLNNIYDLYEFYSVI